MEVLIEGGTKDRRKSRGKADSEDDVLDFSVVLLLL